VSFIDRIFQQKLKPSVPTELARKAPGPMTEHEAWDMAKSLARSMDKGAKLLLITSGTDLQADGKSFTGEFLFALGVRGARLLLTYGPAPNVSDVDSAPITLEKRITASTERAVRDFPMRFRDSPEVVAEFCRAGVDFLAGPTDMKLESRFSSDGRPVWVTYFWDKKIETNFSERSG
jgi:hypothetical protein